MELEYNAKENKLVNKDGFSVIRDRLMEIYTIEANIKQDLSELVSHRRKAESLINKAEDLDLRMGLADRTKKIGYDLQISQTLKQIVQQWKSIDFIFKKIAKQVTGVF